MQTQLIPIDQIDRNPFDSRQVRAQADIDAKAASIKQHGLLQEPKARAVTVKSETRYQLAYGWTRFEGWKIAKPGEPFPVMVAELNDEQMSLHSFEENDKQNALTQIEKARWLAKHMDIFQVTQAQMARVLDKESATISNLLRLLQLPGEIQDLMLKGLPERLARQLIPLSKAYPKEAGSIAEKIFQADEGERERTLNDELWLVFRSGNFAKHLEWTHFSPDWKPENLGLAKDGLEPTAAPACKGCPLQMVFQGSKFCLRVGCYDAKQHAWQQREVARVAEKLGVAATNGKPDVATLLPIGWGDTRAQMKAALALKDPALRIVPAQGSSGGAQLSEAEGLLGSKSVVLAAATPADAQRIGALIKKASAVDTPKRGAPDAQAKREQAARREAHDLIKRAAPQLALALFPLAVPGVVVDALFEEWKYSYPGGHDQAVAAYKGDKRAVLALVFLSRRHRISNYGMVNVAAVRKGVSTLAKAVGVKLNANDAKGAVKNTATKPAKGRGNAKAAKGAQVSATKPAKGQDMTVKRAGKQPAKAKR